MTIVTTSEFRANQGRYLGMVDSGERVILKSRRGSYCLSPVKDKAKKPRRDITTQVCQAMKDWKDYLETGKSDKFLTWEEMMDELRD